MRIAACRRVRWSARWGGADEDNAYGVAAAPGGVYITGDTRPDLTTAGRLLLASWSLVATPGVPR